MKSNKNLSELSALSGLPKSWSWVKLGDVCEINPRLHSNKYDDSLDVSFLPMKAVEELTGRIDLIDERKLGKVKKGYTYFGEGDVIFAKITPCMENGKVAITTRLKNGIGFGSTEFHVLRPQNILLNKFLFHYLIQKSYRKIAQRNMTGTAGQLRVPKRFIENSELLLPPLPEQKKIVEKIEELFSGLDSGVASLKKAREQIRLYRQSVLAAAFSGRLLKASRDDIFSIQDSSPKDVISNAHQLPEGWKWVKVRDICKKIIGGGTPSTKVAEYWEGNIDWITSADIYGIKDIRPRKKINTKAIENSATNLLPKGNIVVVTRVGLGKLAINKNDLCFSQDSQGLILNKDIVINTYALWYLSNAVQVFKYKNRGTTINGVTKRQLAELDFILPPKTEQTQIVEEIEKRFSEADNLEKAIDESLAKAETLRQSILKQAFEGKLV
jgi:type I restriction enzyme S subunit